MAASPSPLATPKPSRAGLGCAVTFGLLFVAVGFAAFWFASLRPILGAIHSAGWIRTPCEILSSELERHSGSDSTTYRVAIRYRYQWPPGGLPVENVGSGAISPDLSANHGADYRESDRYDFSTGSTNVGVDRMRAAVRDNPPGRRTVCLVDPDDPSSAVLTRGIPTSAWFGSLTLLFPLVGGLFIFFAWRGSRKALADARSPLANASTVEPGRPRASQAAPDAPASASSGEILLKPASGRVGAFVGITFFALFWNGILGVFVYHALKDFGNGFFGWFLPLFLIPFVLIGLVVLGAALQAFSRLFAPAVEVRLDPTLLRLGSRLPFTWRLGGRGVRKLGIRLVAREEATYRQGTSTTTDRSDLYRATLLESTDPLGLGEGRAEISLPSEGVAPAFSAKNNKLVWELVFEGEIPWRADIDDRFVLPVRGRQGLAPYPGAPEAAAYPGENGLTLWTVDRFAPGDTLVFTLSIDASGTSGPLTAQLGWFTEGRGTRDAGIVWSERIPDMATGAERGFEIRLPEAPWSFSGKLVSVAWRLEVIDEKGRPLVAVPLVVAPAGEAVSLPQLPKEPIRRQWKTLHRGFR